MRVGSRWLHYLLRDLLHKKVSGELDVSTIPECQEMVLKYFRQNKIVKFHHAKPQDILQLKGDFKVIGIVRNPRDRVVSYAFHQRYKPPGQGLEEVKLAKTDREAVEIALRHPLVQKHNDDQFALMIRNMSTRSYNRDNKQRYIWTTYHWLKRSLTREIQTLTKFLGVNINIYTLRNICASHEFGMRSGRIPGREVREDEWFRKGIENDYKNWFSEEMDKNTAIDDGKYWRILRAEEGD